MKFLRMSVWILLGALSSAALAKVDASGKKEVALDSLPADVLQVVMDARPGFQPESAEYETRNGNEYFDIEGEGADGLEVEFDLTKIDGIWTIVETQRDVSMEDVPGVPSTVLTEVYPDFVPERIIESDQGGGLIIYEFFGPGPDGDPIKIEVSFEAGKSAVLEEEWQH